MPHNELSLKVSTPKVPCIVIERIQILDGRWIEGLIVSLDVGRRPPSVPSCLGHSMRKLTTWQLVSLEQTREEPAREGKPGGSHNLL